MKKAIIVLSGMLLPVAGIAQENEIPKFVPGVYALKMSPNGKWIGSMAGDASIYEVATGENIYYPECSLGLGNAVADNGMAVGCNNEIGAVMYNGNRIYPEAFMKYDFCNLNGITKDASRVAGYLSSDEDDQPTYVPFVALVDQDGNVGEPVLLPIPEKDFFGGTPQYVTAVWISDDGKTVVGDVLDWRGLYSYPIYFKENPEGEWDYYLPTEHLFNPTGIEILPNPWFNEPPFPEPENFMTGALKDAYMAAYEAFSSGAGPSPDPKDYMSSTQYEEYVEAVDSYNEWFHSQEDAMWDYYDMYRKILETSPTFSSNDMAMHPSGQYFMIHGGKYNDEGTFEGTIFNISTDGEKITEVKAPSADLFPYQILENGTLVITRGIEDVPTSYIKLADSDDFITLQEYFEGSMPSVVTWLNETVPGGTGVVLISEDMSLFTGALIPDQLADFDYENSPFYYSTYFIFSDTAGVESVITQPQDGVYRVYNLQGVKVMETNDVSEINNLSKGIYIVNGKKVVVK